ncbi:MAG: BrnT family toxin [Syntrophobacteraceae bacterium]
MRYFCWNDEKNECLKAERDISFEEVVFHIERGDLLDIIEHPNQDRYQGQRVFIVDIENYAYLVPFTESDEKVFLKTIIPSRKATRKYLKRGE